MAEYKVEVTTGDMLHADTYDNIYATLIGTEGESERTNLNSSGLDFKNGMTGTYTVKASSTLGRLLLVRLEKEQYLILPENIWFCSKIVVTPPEEESVVFPCHRWISRGEVVELRGGKATKVFEDELPLLVNHRRQELVHQKLLYKWVEYAEGMPHMNSASVIQALPVELHFSFTKTMEMAFTQVTALAELKLKGLSSSSEQWEDLEKMKTIFWGNKTDISEYVSEHWKEDDFFGSQFLNGPNPNLIQRCKTLPPNFPVTDVMVKPSLEDGSSLATETLKGNIFICDYKRLEDVPTRMVNGEPLPLTAALCLFYKNPEDKLLPIAIQLGQKPSEQNPIFLPSDSEHDWILAKMFVRNADFVEHQFNYHLLGTHYLPEVYNMATLRNLPLIHPLFKLLIPHFRHTLQINLICRERIFGPEGSLTTDSTLGVDGLFELMKRSLSEMTYSSLCLPGNIIGRGLESIPNFYYRDDGLKLWTIINSFVQGMVKHFYPSDGDVSKDSELQEWIGEIFTHGFLGNSNTGIPQKFDKVDEVVKFITMVIFTVSAQHSGINMGQFDYGGWIPNSPPMLRKAPPTTKGSSTMDTILETLPDVGTTVRSMAFMWLLGKKYSDFVPLGTYPDGSFQEPALRQMITQLHADLASLDAFIPERNAKLVLRYRSMRPADMENSVSI